MSSLFVLFVIAQVGSCLRLSSRNLRQPYPDFFAYFPHANVAVCSCLKCGSTSLYALAYETVFSKEWPYQGRPWIQNVYSPRWQGKVKTISVNAMRQKNVTSIALLRDPKERLTSAWKSKVACDEADWNTDTFERQNVVDNLLLLANRSQGSRCMPFDEYLEVLHDIHEAGDARKLNWHFLPQQYGCFQRLLPEEWTVASTIGDPKLASSLSVALGGPSVVNMPYTHFSGSKEVQLSEKAKQLLDYLTRKEYDIVGRHLASSTSEEGNPPSEVAHPFWVP